MRAVECPPIRSAREGVKKGNVSVEALLFARPREQWFYSVVKIVVKIYERELQGTLDEELNHEDVRN